MKIEVIIINLTGMILKMRYCILEQVGAGGEGHLYLARDMELGNYWAVKELPLEKKREARLLRLLEHPSIPRMVDYVENGDHCSDHGIYSWKVPWTDVKGGTCFCSG